MTFILLLMIIAVSQDSVNTSVVYIRWGKKNCPTSAELVHSGYAGGSHFTHTGAAVNSLCLPKNPEWASYTDRVDGYKNYIFGAEYETYGLNGKWLPLHNHDVPCAVCLVRNTSVVEMFPARSSCYNGWKLEYNGYLMAGHYNHNAGTMYRCVDHNPESLPGGGNTDSNGCLFYMVEARCGSLKCPPYVDGREIVCAVCSLGN